MGTSSLARGTWTSSGCGAEAVDRGAVLGRLARLVAVTDRRKPVVVRLCEAARIQVGARGSSISINSDDSTKRMTLAATDDIAAQLEELQDVLGEGPCR